MWNLERVLGTIVAVTAALMGGFNFGWKGILLVISAFIAGFILCSGRHVEYEDVVPEHDSCDGCKHNLGGGHCAMSVYDECNEGGGFEAWEAADGNRMYAVSVEKSDYPTE